MTDPTITKVRRVIDESRNRGGMRAGMPKVTIDAADAERLCAMAERVAELEADAERYQEVKRRAKRMHHMFFIDLDISVGPTDFECVIDAARLTPRAST